ncbi:MAG: PilN domain-containing protein [Myxococcota bacterium]
MIEINLLPIREERRKADLQQQGLLLLATLIGSVLLAGGYHAVLLSSVSSAESGTQQLQRQIDAFGPQLAQVEEFRTAKAEIEKKLAVIDTLDRSRSGPVHVLDELATHTPDRVWLTKLETGKRGVGIEGFSLDNELVALFLTALGESPYFRDVELETTELLERDGLKLNEFRLRARLSTEIAADDAEDITSAGVGG